MNGSQLSTTNNDKNVYKFYIIKKKGPNELLSRVTLQVTYHYKEIKKNIIITTN